MNKPVGGRGKKALYESTHHRIPEPLKPAIELLTNQYKEYVFEGNSLDFDNRTLLPKLPAIYFVLQDEEIIYIGQTKNLVDRWRRHHIINQLTGLSGKISIAWLQFEDGTLLSVIESFLITALEPRLNGQGVCLQDSEGKFLIKYKNEPKKLRSIRLTQFAINRLDEIASQKKISRTEVIEQLTRNHQTKQEILLNALNKFIEIEKGKYGSNPTQKGKEFSIDTPRWGKFKEFKDLIQNVPWEVLGEE